MTGPLNGIRVIDLSTGIAGPVATMHMADFGADVIKAEPPCGDPARAMAGFAVWNRNKRGIVIDLESEAGRDRLEEFLAGADVCVIGGSAPRVDLDAQALSAKYPSLVVLDMPPYTVDGAPWAGGAESQGLLAAFAAPAARQSSFDGGPIEMVYPLTLYVQGQWAAASAVAALIERERSSRGQVVHVAGLHGVMVACVGAMNVVPGQQPLPTNVGPGGRHPTYTTYRGKDGRWLFMAALTPKFQANAFKVLGVGNLFADERIQGSSARLLLPENRGWIRELLTQAFQAHTRDEWLALLEQGDIPAGPVGERNEWLDHPQVCANGLRVELEDSERGAVVMPGLPLVLKETPAEIRTPAPRLGQHDAIVERWEPPRRLSTGDAPKTQRGPLAGFRVLDLGTILAGPYAGTLLAELGADVVKVEAPVGDPFRDPGFIYNRGQRGLAIDLSSDAARQAFYALVRTADAVVDNSRLGVLERLQIDYAHLKDVKPDIVALSVNSFGEGGSFAHKPGFDPVLQAMSGMMAAQGGDSDPVLFTIPVNDIAAATFSVLGVCLGLFHRVRTGVGQRAWTSLIGCSAIMQSGELVRFKNRPPAVHGARDFKGPSALHRFYQAKDGWLRLQAPDVSGLQAAGLLGACTSASSDAEFSAALTERLQSMSLEEALECLARAGVPAAKARGPAALVDDPRLRELDAFAQHQLQDGTPFYTTNRFARFSRTQVCAVLKAPGIGEHSRELLTEAGLTAAEIDALVASGAVKEGGPLRVAAIQNYR